MTGFAGVILTIYVKEKSHHGNYNTDELIICFIIFKRYGKPMVRLKQICHTSNKRPVSHVSRRWCVMSLQVFGSIINKHLAPYIYSSSAIFLILIPYLIKNVCFLCNCVSFIRSFFILTVFVLYLFDNVLAIFFLARKTSGSMTPFHFW